MLSFIPHPLPTPCQTSTRSHTHQPPQSIATPLQAFISFCHRSQTTLCSLTAQKDGLGTFHLPPHPPPVRSLPPMCTLHGGRRFQASVNIWQTPPPSMSKLDAHASAGLALKITPRDPLQPALRADVHYFELKDTWWFGGGVDILNIRNGGIDWHHLNAQYQIDISREELFLERCWGVNELQPDRDIAFAFVGDVVDGLLPRYFRLLDGDSGAAPAGDGVQRFCITGGAECETVLETRDGVAAWSFALAPSHRSWPRRRLDQFSREAFDK